MLKVMNNLFDIAANSWGRMASWLPLSPLVLRIRITNRCNLSCHYCYVGSSLNRKTQDLLSLSEWKKIIYDLPPYTIIDLTGGEPLLAPNIDQILETMLDQKLKVSLITNGTVKKDDVFDLIVAKKLMHFMVSMDGPEALHDEVRGKGSFEKAMKTIKGIQDRKSRLGVKYPKVVAKVTVTEENATSLMDFIPSLFDKQLVDGVTLNLLFSNKARDGFADEISLDADKFKFGNEVTFTQEKIKELVEAITQLKKNYKEKISIRPDMEIEDLTYYFTNPKSVMPKDCQKFKSVVTLYSEGTLTPCDIGLNVVNIRELNYSLRSIFKQKQMSSFLKKLDATSSQFFAACGGCCLKKHEKV